jgi:hypothetical protein
MRITFLFIFSLMLASCWNGEKNTNTPKQKLTPQHRYTEFTTDNYTAVVLKCDVGRLKLNIYQYANPKIEIHKTYQKYVKLVPENDTLFIYVSGTPKSTEQVKIHKNINLYLPDLSYLESEVSQITVHNYAVPKLKIVNKSNALRLYNCKIRELTVSNKGLCNIHFDGNNHFDKVQVTLNSKSYFTSYAQILTSLTLKTPSLQNTRFTNLPSDGFFWIKE